MIRAAPSRRSADLPLCRLRRSSAVPPTNTRAMPPKTMMVFSGSPHAHGPWAGQEQATWEPKRNPARAIRRPAKRQHQPTYAVTVSLPWTSRVKLSAITIRPPRAMTSMAPSAKPTLGFTLVVKNGSRRRRPSASATIPAILNGRKGVLPHGQRPALAIYGFHRRVWETLI